MDKMSREILRPNHAGCFIRNDTNMVDKCINYGCIRIENDILIYWTREAMISMFNSEEKRKELQSYDEKYLIENGHVETIALKDIYRVIF
jgi:hypothetical protein